MMLVQPFVLNLESMYYCQVCWWVGTAAEAGAEVDNVTCCPECGFAVILHAEVRYDERPS